MFSSQSHTVLRMMPADIGGTVTPGFTGVARGEASENERDESDILANQDVTESFDNALDENMGAKTNSLDALEEEPDGFLAGEVDVKEQMDRAAKSLDFAIHSHETGEQPSDTPGGLEEVAMKTDQALAKRSSQRTH